MTETLRKAILMRSRLKNCFHKARSEEKWLLYKTQRNLSIKMKSKKENFSKVKPKLVSDNKNFW